MRMAKLGGSAPGTTNDDSAKSIRAALGLPIQLVTGYKGTAPIKLSAEGGEIDGGCWAWESISTKGSCGHRARKNGRGAKADSGGYP